MEERVNDLTTEATLNVLSINRDSAVPLYFQLKEQIKKLEEKQKAAKVDDSELKKKDEIITALKSIIDDYIYPNAANAILRKEGILKIENNIIDDEVIDKQMMNANTSIDKGETEGADKEKKISKYASVNSLLGAFDD